MDGKELYFIALIPDDELRREIRVIKERIKSLYGAGHALKSPAHITLQMPFKRSPADEATISEVLGTFASQEKPFAVDLDGYGTFSQRVIYIRVKDPDPICSLHRRMKEMLAEGLGFGHEEIMKDVKPHITVATRDLTRQAFSEAWPEFRDRKFTGHLEVKSLCLLKHNGRDWDIMEEFPFGIR